MYATDSARKYIVHRSHESFVNKKKTTLFFPPCFFSRSFQIQHFRWTEQLFVLSRLITYGCEHLHCRFCIFSVSRSNLFFSYYNYCSCAESMTLIFIFSNYDDSHHMPIKLIGLRNFILVHVVYFV